jgi:hypothetical protein
MNDLMQNEEERKTELENEVEEKNESMVYEESVKI